MEPSNDHERAIKVAVDTIATEGRLSLESIPEVADSLQFMMSRSDTKFLVQYMRWRMDKPRTFSVMDSRTVSGYRKHSGRGVSALLGDVS